MSIFSPASIKIRDLLGLTASGQGTKANSLPVTLASDEDAIAIAGTVPVSGPLTDTELRATPVPVLVESTDDDVSYAPRPYYSYGAVRGGNPTDDLIAGTTGDWYAIRGTSDGDPSDILETNANASEYFNAEDPAFNTDPIWIYIPIEATIYENDKYGGGFEKFSAFIKNSLGSSAEIAITLYAVPDKVNFAFETTSAPISDEFDYWIIASQTMASGDTQIFGPNGISVGAYIDRPIGWLVIKAVPDNTLSGYWSLAVKRSR